MNTTKNIKFLYAQKQFPAFQNRMYDTREEAINCPKGDISLVQNLETGLVYNEAFNCKLMDYDGSYQNEQAVSSLFKQHLNEVSRIIENKIGKKKIVEIGCGKGYFLEKLLSKGFDVIGFDPTYEGENERVFREYFQPKKNQYADGLVLRHVLEHVENPFDFLLKIKEANNNQGKIYIEVPCFDWILRNKVWFDIFYEHVNYFRMCDFFNMFDSILDSGYIFGGQYIYVVADLYTLKYPKVSSVGEIGMPMEFDNIRLPKFQKKVSVIWGGASKGVIYALLCERFSHPISAVIDINPAKQGKYLAGSGLLVQPPEKVLNSLPADSNIYVMNLNYLEEIKAQSNNKYNYIGVENV